MSDAYANIVAALETAGCKVRSGRDSARAQCPTHHSTGLTLSVRCGDDRASVHCFAGCDDTDVLTVLGLGVSDLFDGDRPAGYVPPPRRKPTPWEAAMAELGLHHPPPLDHVLERMVFDQTPDDDGATFDERRERDIAEARRARPGDRAAGEVTSW